MRGIVILLAMAFQVGLAAQGVQQGVSIPFTEGFGTGSFNQLPTGFVVWNGINGTTTNTQFLAETSVPSGTALISARTGSTTTGGAYGLGNNGNGRIYIQSSSNATEGLNQLSLSFLTGVFTAVRVSYKIETIEPGTGRNMGTVLQYRQGNAGAWTTIPGTARVYNNSSSNSGDADVAGDLDEVEIMLTGLLPGEQYQLRWAHWRSGSTGNSVGLAYDDISVLPVPSLFEVSGGGNVCAGGSGKSILLSGSQTGVIYHLLVNDEPTGETVIGDGNVLVFAPRTEPGIYQVEANYPGGPTYPMAGQGEIAVIQPPTPADAGPDEQFCNQQSIQLNAAVPQHGVGWWSQVSGAQVYIADPFDPATPVGGLLPGQYIFRWSVEFDECPISEDDVIITIAGPLEAYAGPDQAACSKNIHLEASTPASGTGKWKVLSGPGQAEFNDAYDPNAFATVTVPGTYIFRWTVGNEICDEAYDDVEISFTSAPVLVNVAPSVNSLVYGQVLNPITLKITDDGATGDISLSFSYSLNAGAIVQGLPVNLQYAYSTDGILSLSQVQNAFVAAGSYRIFIKAVDLCNAVAEAHVDLQVIPAQAVPQAEAFYTGSKFFWTTGPQSKNANLLLAAAVRNSPGTAGDIRTARVSFFVRSGTQLLPIHGAQNLPVGLADAGDLSQGIASASVNYNLGSASAAILDIAIMVSGNYTSSNDPSQDRAITVAVPVPGGQICGGVEVENQQSAGQLKGISGSLSNICFFLQYNNSLKNVQGGAEIRFSSLHDRFGIAGTIPRHYIIRSNSISSLSITGNSAQFSSKAALFEIVGGVETAVEGNCHLVMDITDHNSTPDKIAVSVYRKSGGLWYSTAWTGTQHFLKEIHAGNISVSGSNTAVFRVQENNSGVRYRISVRPNPFSSDFSLQLDGWDPRQPVMVRIVNALGKEVYAGSLQVGTPLFLGGAFASGVYFLRLSQGKEERSCVLVKQ